MTVHILAALLAGAAWGQFNAASPSSLAGGGWVHFADVPIHQACDWPGVKESTATVPRIEEFATAAPGSMLGLTVHGLGPLCRKAEAEETAAPVILPFESPEK